VEDQNEKFSEMADKRPRKALYYGMGIVIVTLLTFNRIQYTKTQTIEEKCQQREDSIRAEAKREKEAEVAMRFEMYEKQIEKSEATIKLYQEKTFVLSEKVEALYSKSTAIDSKYQKIENKIGRINSETKKIEEVIQQ
jgi:hypothetical protein